MRTLGIGFVASLVLSLAGCHNANSVAYSEHEKLVDRVATLENQVAVMDGRVESLEYQVRDCCTMPAGEGTVYVKPAEELPCPAPDKQRAIEPRAALPGKIKAKLVGEPHDGDTVLVQVSVRLAEIDAPELKQPWGPEARGVLVAELKQAKTLSLRVEAVDRYGRVVGSLLDDNGSINRMMIERGAAWHYKAYSSDASLDVLEETARKNNRGLWGDERYPNPQAPWDYRHAKGLED